MTALTLPLGPDGIASTRSMVTEMSSPSVERRAAEDTLRRLDVRYEGKPVMDPVTGYVVVAALALIISGALAWKAMDGQTAEGRLQILRRWLKFAGCILAAPLVP